MSKPSDALRARVGRTGRFRLSNWPVLAKVAVVLAIPVLVAAGFGAIRIQAEASDASAYARAERQTQVLPAAMEFLGSLEDVTVARDFVPEASVKRYEAALAALQASRPGSDLDTEQSTALDNLISVGAVIRTKVVNSGVAAELESARSANAQVKIVLDGIANEQPVSTVDFPVFNDLLTARTALLSQVLLERSLAWSGSVGDRVSLSREVGIEANAVERLAVDVGIAGPAITTLTNGNAERLTALKSEAMAGTLPGIRASTKAYDEVAKGLANRIAGAAKNSASAARQAALRDAALIVGLLLIALVIAVIVARSLIKPLRVVRRGVVDIATKHLPDAIEQVRQGRDLPPAEPLAVTSRDEIGQLSRAVDDMHGRARLLATEQAQLRTQIGNMFVTLSRRSNSLVTQQLSLIEQLERDEDDPGRLDSLFKLDHLAARMRRNGDSLLVLAGTPNRGATTGQLSVTDTLRAAVSEVQDYRRVVLGSAPEAYFDGQVASDLVHVFAELIDNALAYSPPASQVVLSGRTIQDGGIVIDVADSGIGIPTEDRELHNTGLQTGGEVTPDAARHMGLFVVGRLATAHDVVVRLQENPGGGTIAAVMVPAGLLTSKRTSGTGPAPRPRAAIAGQRPRQQVAGALPRPAVSPVLGRIGGPADAPASLPQRRAAPVGSATPGPVATRRLTAGPISPVPLGANTGTPKPLPRRKPVASEASVNEQAAGPELDGAEHVGAEHNGAEQPSLPRRVAVNPQGASAFLSARSRLQKDGAPERAGSTPASSAQSAASPSSRKANGKETAASPKPGTAEPSPVGAGIALAGTLLPGLVKSAAASGRLAGPDRLSPDLSDQPPRTELSETPIFRQLRSQWLDTRGSDALPWGDSEIERGWSAADRASKAKADGITTSGLPRRRPGAQLVPGGVSTRADNGASRDPQQIRERLDRHLSGVRRGRSETGTPVDRRPRHGL